MPAVRMPWCLWLLLIQEIFFLFAAVHSLIWKILLRNGLINKSSMGFGADLSDKYDHEEILVSKGDH